MIPLLSTFGTSILSYVAAHFTFNCIRSLSGLEMCCLSEPVHTLLHLLECGEQRSETKAVIITLPRGEPYIYSLYIILNLSQGVFCFPHFIDEKTKASEVYLLASDPIVRTWRSQGLNPSLFDSKEQAVSLPFFRTHLLAGRLGFEFRAPTLPQ